MADFIYLLQNRLTPAQWRALEVVREAARAHGMPVFLVGGAVRDLSSGSPVRDLDFALQGEVDALLPALESSGARVAGRNAVLSSVYLSFPGGVRGELGPSLAVSYPKPGEPNAHPAPILDDLRRRDFTANAMAVSLNEGSYGLLLDPLNGTADIENREFRLVSAYGFIEQPALLLRAARLSERLGWNLEERTAQRYETSKEEGHIQALPAADRGYELEEIFHEEDPVAILEHMQAEGWGEVLFPALRPSDADQAGMDGVREMIGQLESQGLHPDPSALYFPLLTAKLSDRDRAALKRTFARPGFVQQIETTEARAKELGTQLSSKAAAQPSDSWRMLHAAEPDLVLWLASNVRTGTVQAKIKAFLKDWPQMRARIPYSLMQEMRITPDLPEYEQLLDNLFFALIDGKLDTPEATRAFLEPFSPPAPPQVAVRRRPAKSARGRSKRVVEEAVDEAEDTELDGAADGSEESEEPELTDGTEQRPETEPGKQPESLPSSAPVPAPQEATARVPAVKAKKVGAKAGPAVTPQPPVAADPSQAKASAGANAAPKAPATQPQPGARAGGKVPEKAAAAPANSVTPTKKAPVKLAAKAVAGKATGTAAKSQAKGVASKQDKLSAKLSSKSSTKSSAKSAAKLPAKLPPKPSSKSSARPSSKFASKPVAKSIAKKTAKKSAAKIPTKTATKTAQRGTTPKRPLPPKGSGKGSGKRSVKAAGKTAAKKQPVKGRVAVAAKRGTPTKAAKKVAPAKKTVAAKRGR